MYYNKHKETHYIQYNSSFTKNKLTRNNDYAVGRF